MPPRWGLAVLDGSVTQGFRRLCRLRPGLSYGRPRWGSGRAPSRRRRQRAGAENRMIEGSTPTFITPGRPKRIGAGEPANLTFSHLAPIPLVAGRPVTPERNGADGGVLGKPVLRANGSPRTSPGRVKPKIKTCRAPCGRGLNRRSALRASNPGLRRRGRLRPGLFSASRWGCRQWLANLGQ
jgi:hypothetical protein